MNFSLFDRDADLDYIRALVSGIHGAAREMLPGTKEYMTVYSCIDHTRLDGLDHEAGIAGFALEVAEQGRKLPGSPHVAAVCVYPVFAGTVRHALTGSGIKTASVAGAFPSAQAPLPLRLDEARFAIDQGAEEIDMVISRGKMISGEYQAVFDEIASFRMICSQVVLKVILETGELRETLLIARAAEIALRAGADFVKTSTGKIPVGYTPEAASVILSCIRQFHQETGKMAGFKASGGIAEPDAALTCLYLVRSMLGEAYLVPGLFRIGASRLTGKIAVLLHQQV